MKAGIPRILGRINTVALMVAGASVLVMTLAGGFDVLSTATLNTPIPAVYELTESLMVVVVFLSLGHLQLAGLNIEIDILPKYLGPKGRRIQAAMSQAIALVFFSALTWQAWLMAMQSWAIREFSTGLVQFPLYPSKFAVGIGGVLTVMCAAYRLVAICAGGDERPGPAAHPE